MAAQAQVRRPTASIWLHPSGGVLFGVQEYGCGEERLQNSLPQPFLTRQVSS
jgi:hypothetical protein